jgi:hypothetical protein
VVFGLVVIDPKDLAGIEEQYWKSDEAEELKVRLLTELDWQAPGGYEFVENDNGEFGFWEEK